MGWRDRDWAKFDEGEQRALLGGRATPRRRAATLGGRRAAGPGLLLAVAVSAVAVVLGTHLHIGTTAGNRPPTRQSSLPANVVPIRWRSFDLAPAANAGRICVTDGRHGRICASYVAGERPADTLTRQVMRLGLRVESIG